MTRNNMIAGLLTLLLCAACSDTSSNQTVSMYPDQQSAGFKQFTKQCSACHRPPMPNIHPANLWVTTVYRMQQHRQKRGLAVMTDAQQGEVLAYLQSHSQ